MVLGGYIGRPGFPSILFIKGYLGNGFPPREDDLMVISGSSGTFSSLILTTLKNEFF